MSAITSTANLDDLDSIAKSMMIGSSRAKELERQVESKLLDEASRYWERKLKNRQTNELNMNFSSSPLAKRQIQRPAGISSGFELKEANLRKLQDDLVGNSKQLIYQESGAHEDPNKFYMRRNYLENYADHEML